MDNSSRDARARFASRRESSRDKCYFPLSKLVAFREEVHSPGASIRKHYFKVAQFPPFRMARLQS